MVYWYRLIGCYEALDGGELSEALADFTGGVSETTDLTNEAYQTDEDQRDHFYDWLSRAIDNNSLMCAAITVSPCIETRWDSCISLEYHYIYAVYHFQVKKSDLLIILTTCFYLV